MGDPLRFSDTLRHFIASDTGMSELPASFGSLSHLVRLLVPNFCNRSRHTLTTLPSSLGSLGKLQHISMEGQGIGTIPASIFRLDNLSDFELTRCPVVSMPQSLLAIRRPLRVWGCEALAASGKENSAHHASGPDVDWFCRSNCVLCISVIFWGGCYGIVLSVRVN